MGRAASLFDGDFGLELDAAAIFRWAWFRSRHSWMSQPWTLAWAGAGLSQSYMGLYSTASLAGEAPSFCILAARRERTAVLGACWIRSAAPDLQAGP